MIIAAVKRLCPTADPDIKKAALSLRILKYGENKAFFDQILSRKNKTARQNSIMAYELLDNLLCSHTKIKTATLSRDSLGKPCMDNENISFNISHTDTAVACVIDTDGNSVGIDIERIYRDGTNIINRFFDGAAKSRLASSDKKPLTFAEIWTEKEAYSKLEGTGLTDYSTEYPKPHAFTRFTDGSYFVTVCSERGEALLVCQNAEDWQKV